MDESPKITLADLLRSESEVLKRIADELRKDVDRTQGHTSHYKVSHHKKSK